MGYKIWRKDKHGWDLAFDTVYDTKDKADEYIASLNAQYAEMVKYGELSFYPYREDIKLDKNGEIIDTELHRRIRKPRRPHRRKKR